MKNIITALLVAGAFYCSSCSSEKGASAYVVQKSDSVTNKGYLNISFASKNFLFTHLNVLKVPVHSLVSVTKSYDKNDTLFITQIQVADHKSQVLSMDLTIYNNTSGTAVGTYVITKNNCTFTDFSEGQNRVYAINPGGIVDITKAGQTTEGTFTFDLYYNHVAYPATGNFVINNF